MKPYRSITHRTPSKSHRTSEAQLNRSHIVENSLDKKNDLIHKYQTEINDLIEQIDAKQPYRKSNERKKILNPDSTAKRKRAISSLKKQTAHLQSGGNPIITQGQAMKDYQKLILGLQFSLETQKGKNTELKQKNQSLQSQISNLRNLLMGPDDQKYYEKTAIKESQQKITYLENRIIQQKKQYEFIIETKNQEIVALQKQLKITQKAISKDQNNDKALVRKLADLNQELEELKTRITRKNIQIQRLKYQKVKEDDSDDEQIIKLRKNQRLNFYLQQLSISNKLILRKNSQILQLSNRVMLNQKILDIIELYLDKKEVRNADLYVLEHPCVNKLRILLREKAVFERELLNQLNQHNKKISQFQSQLTGRDKYASDKLTQTINDNKRLATTVTSLQSNIANLQRQLDHEKKQNEMLNNQIVINKRQFVQEVNKMKEQLGKISSVTKNQFDRMKIENLKLTQQNRSLLFLVGEKEREIHKKGEAIKTFEQYKQKINTLNVGETHRRKIQAVSEEQPGIASKILLIDNFSNWVFEWKKIKNWTNKKTLLNLILDKQEIRDDSLSSLTYVISVIQDCFLLSKNIEIQQRAIILLAYYVPHKILSHKEIYLSKIIPIVIRGFRAIIEGQQTNKHTLLNESTLKIMNQLEKINYKWTHEMTNEMLSINGLKYVFDILKTNKLDEFIESAYNILIMIAKQNQMISFMMSYDVNNIIFNGLGADNSFILFTLTLVKNLLEGDDYIKLQKSLNEYHRLFRIVAEEDDQSLLQLALDCIQLLMNKSVGGFLRPLDKMKSLSILSKLLRKSSEEITHSILKKTGKIYIDLVAELETEKIGKFIKIELDNLLEIIKQKRINEPRFVRALKIMEKLTPIFQQTPEFDYKILPSVLDLYSLHEHIDSTLRLKISRIVYMIYKRNSECLDKYSNDSLINNLLETYKTSINANQQLTMLLSLILFECEQKRVIEVLRAGRQSLIHKLIQDSLVSDYSVTIVALKVMLLLSKEKFIEKFLNVSIISNLVNKVLNERGEEQYIGITLSILYFLSKIQTIGTMVIESGGVNKICSVILERHDKQPLIFKSLAVLQVLNTIHYKRKILSYLISKETNLQVIKVLNFSLRKAKNKIQLGTRSVFIYDFLNTKVAVESLAILTERNEWLIEDLVMLRNQYVKKVDSLVYKIELLLHQMSKVSNKVKKIYQKYKVEDDGSEEDD